MEEKKRYKAIINGKTYTIIGPEGKSQLDLVTQMVQTQFNELKKLSPDLTMEDAAILMAINAVNDQVKKQRELLEIKKELVDLKASANELEDLRNKVKKMTEVEEKARIALKEAGQDTVVENPLQAQKILNQLQKQKIRSKSEE